MQTNKATLYHAPLGCSLAVRIAATYGDVPVDVIQVDLDNFQTLDGRDYKEINPLGQVATLFTPKGEKITETVAALLWVQSQSPNDDFRLEPSDTDYFQLIRWLSFTSSEFHKQIYRMVFYSELDEASKDNIRALAPDRFAVLDTHLSTRDFLLGSRFSAADAYLTWVMLLSKRAGLDPSPYANLTAYTKRAQALPKVRDVIADDWKRK